MRVERTDEMMLSPSFLGKRASEDVAGPLAIRQNSIEYFAKKSQKNT